VEEEKGGEKGDMRMKMMRKRTLAKLDGT